MDKKPSEKLFSSVRSCSLREFTIFHIWFSLPTNLQTHLSSFFFCLRKICLFPYLQKLSLTTLYCRKGGICADLWRQTLPKQSRYDLSFPGNRSSEFLKHQRKDPVLDKEAPEHRKSHWWKLSLTNTEDADWSLEREDWYLCTLLRCFETRCTNVSSQHNSSKASVPCALPEIKKTHKFAIFHWFANKHSMCWSGLCVIRDATQWLNRIHWSALQSMDDCSRLVLGIRTVFFPLMHNACYIHCGLK